jgi:hypothetical protein
MMGRCEKGVGLPLTSVNKVLFSNLVRSRFWLAVRVTTYLLSVSRSAAMKPPYVVLGESTRSCLQSNGADVACRGVIVGPACTAAGPARRRDMTTDESDSTIFVDFCL